MLIEIFFNCLYKEIATMKKSSSNLEYKPQSCWEKYATTSSGHKSIMKLATSYIDFLSQCKTERETIDYALKRLAEQGYADGVHKSMALYNFRNKALFVARRGSLSLSDGIHLISAHVDTPRLDFKQRPFIEQPGVAQAKTHYYGGIRKYQWLARPLALHGVIMHAQGSTTVTIGENEGDPVFTIADLLPHLAQKQATQSVSDAFEAEKLNIIMGHSPYIAAKGNKKEENVKEPIKKKLLQILFDKYNLTEEDFISAELQAVPAGPARFVGLDKALVGGFGHDDRLCVFTALEAFLNVKNPKHTTVLMLWDKEEIGSEGATSANSRFLDYCLEDCREAWESKTKIGHILLNSKAISADVQAAIDPDWQEVHEKQNAAQLGYGPCFSKFTGSRGKYGANDADAEFVGYMRTLLNEQSIPWQMAELGKVDLGGGGTVALFLAAYGMQVIDCGPAVLSMHSPFELASCADIWATVLAYTAFFEA